MKTPGWLEELSELEVHLPFRFPHAVLDAVQSIPPIDAKRSQGRHHRTTEADAAEQTRRIEVLGARPDVARVVEGVEVDLLIDAQAELDGVRVERAAERLRLRLVLRRFGDVPARRDRELLVPAQLLPVLHAAERELLRD